MKMKATPPRLLRAATVLALFSPCLHADVPTDLKPLGMGLGGFSYWNSSPFADGMLSSSDWIEFGDGEWGTTEPYADNPQFDANGYPLYLDPGRKLRTLLWPFGARYNNAPDFFPERAGTGVGRWVLIWQGKADLRLKGGSYAAAESNGPATGILADGRRVYHFDATDRPGELVVEAVNEADPITDIEVWTPDPADPHNQSLEGALWHPVFLDYLADLDLNHLRFMDWGATNQSPQRDWSDRRRPAFRNQKGVLNRRSPAEGVVWYTDSEGEPVFFSGDRTTGIAFEYMVDLCNRTGLDLWICLPHLATDDFVRKLARLIRFGSDGEEPYAGPHPDPVYPPLDPDQRVWVEYSNEIWSGGNSFPQGNWAQAQADSMGISKPVFNARRAAQIWSLFQEEFEGSERLVRVAALFTANESYNEDFLTELRDYGPTLDPAVAPDVVSPTTYFGNGIQDWAFSRAEETRGTADQWFLTADNFDAGASSRPVSVPPEDPYWESEKLEEDLAATFREWKARIFSGSKLEGGGPDATGTGGGFPASLRDKVTGLFGEPLPLVSYEGGPSLYTDSYNGGDPRDDGITTFMNILNRREPFREIYRIQLNMALAKGLTANTLFVDTSKWGKWGQWGHLEFPDQDPEDSVKWSAVKAFAGVAEALSPAASAGASGPAFTTSALLPQGNYNVPYTVDIAATEGDASLREITVVGKLLLPGLRIDNVPGDPSRLRLRGAPQKGGWNYLYLRVADEAGKAAWRVFSLYVTGGPGTVLEADLSGSFSGTEDLPWTATFAIDPGVSWDGLSPGAPHNPDGGTATGTDGTGVRLHAETDALRFSVSQGRENEEDATLASALADQEYWTFTVAPRPGKSLDLRGALLELEWIRYRYHAPRGFALFSSVEGFQEGNALYRLPNFPSPDVPVTNAIRLAEDAAYADLSTPVEFRIYWYGSQYSHQAGLLGLKVTRRLKAGSYDHWASRIDWQGKPASAQADANRNGYPNLLEFAFATDPLGHQPASAYPRLREARDSSLTLSFRRNRHADGLAFVLQASVDLAEWSEWTPDGETVVESVVDPDIEGDGAAERVHWRLNRPLPQFLRLRIE
jgi:hypothetical protein